MSIYTYNGNKAFCQALGINCTEVPSLSDQEMSRIVADFPGNYRPYGGGFGIGYKHTDEWKDSKSQSMLAEKNFMYGKTHTSTTRKKIAVSKKGIPPWNKGLTNIYRYDTIVKMKEPKTQEHKDSLKVSFSFVSPAGKIVDVFGLVDFCKQHNLTPSAMSQVASGKRPHHKGWKRCQ